MATTSLNPNLTLIESALSKDDIMKINLYYKDGTFTTNEKVLLLI